MTLGEKIKKERTSKNMTQSELAKNAITRNMISSIENGKAQCSLETLQYLANELEVPLSYLVSDDEDLFFYNKKERMKSIKFALEHKNYTSCINLVLKLENLDDELAYILSLCYFELGVSSCKNGSLKSGKKYLELSLLYSEKTIYDTTKFKAIAPLYLAIAENVNSPLLEFDSEKFESYMIENTEYEFYKYLVMDFNYDFTYPPFKLHMHAKQLIKERKYNDAINCLLEIENKKLLYGYNAYLMFSVYGDLDSCYRNIVDFESAYRYASKRISLIESFNS